MNQEISMPPTNKTTKSSGLKKIINLLLIVGIIGAGALFVWAEQDRRSKQTELESTRAELERIRQSTQQDGDEVARQVLEDVRRLMDVPHDPEPTVATIIDVESLQEANEFYSVASNGDHLIVTDKRAILYSSERNIILDVVPVVLDESIQEEPAQNDTNPPAANEPVDPEPAGTEEEVE